MGCPYAPEMAVLFMAQFELKFIESNNPFKTNIIQWWRYIDDIWCLWQGSQVELDTFHHWLNDRHPDIKFSVQSSNQEITFLDVIVRPREGQLTTSLYRKKTDANTILHYRSWHPQSLKDNLPYGQLLRMRRNCTSIIEYDDHAESFCKEMQTRGYPKKLLKHSFKRARFTPREVLLEQKLQKPVEQLVCVTTYGAHSNKFKKVILKNWHLLEGMECPFPKPLFAMKKNRSIGQQIIKAELPHKSVKSDLRTKWGLQPIEGHRKCGSCVACNTTIEGIEFTHNTFTHKHREFTNCKSRNLIYGIVCPCQKLYIGKTTQQVNTRITQHRSRLKRRVQNAPMVEHFLEKGHGDTEFRWTVLEVVKPIKPQMDVDRVLLRKEAYLILKFKTIETGLNSMSELTRGN